MSNFEWLLKDLGWKPCITGNNATWYDPNTPNTWIDLDFPTYDFIASVPIDDWRKSNHSKYALALEEILGDTRFTNPQAFHNAPLDARIEAHCKARGMA